MREIPMPELTPQMEAQNIASLAGWWVSEWQFFCILADAKFTLQDIRLCMTRGLEN